MSLLAPKWAETQPCNAPSRGSGSLTHARPGPPLQALCSKTGSSWARILGPLTIRSSRTRSVKRSTSSPPKSTAVGLE